MRYYLRPARRSWQPRPVGGVADGLILFDGVCLFCSRWVQFVIARDPAGRFRFAPIQGGFGAALAARLGISAENPETNAVVFAGRAYFKSDAAIAVIERLPGWGWVGALRLIPRPLRDRFYDLVARHRYRWFGRSDSCLVPAPELERRFVSDRPTAGLMADK
jgi:predicted DCC family thiol-disulfide oxidoreductase YuxK